MSELKAIRSGEIYNIIEYEDCYRTDDLYYPKSEADKVIAELEESHKKEVEQLLMGIVKLKADYKEACGRLQTANLIKDEQLAATHHHKYKRCKAKADMCERKRIDAANYRIPRGKWEFYEKWYKRWRELAEKFKEAK
jgi:hypothetical protein